MPRTLIEKSFKERLQHGAAIYILRRVAFLSRFNAVMNNLVDEVLSGECLSMKGIALVECSDCEITISLDLQKSVLTS